jgi:hypothetical protein
MTVKRSANVIKLQPPLRCAEPIPAHMEVEEDDLAWAARSAMWQSRVEKASARRTKRAKAQPALILAGHGVSLRVENGALTIQNGFTHYPQKSEVIRYFRGDVSLPERIMNYARRQRRIVEIRVRFNGAGATERRSCGA